jgi:trk system potassium uptake protein TrkA
VHVIICGTEQVGYRVAERLAAEKNDVSIIDTSADLIRTVRDALDVRGFVGHGAHPDVLEKAGAHQADMIIAVAFYDEVNFVACEVAHALFNVPMKSRVYARSLICNRTIRICSRANTCRST